MKDLGLIHHFLGVEITHTFDGLHLSQSHYTLTILEKADMTDYHPMSIPLEAKTKGLDNNTFLDNPIHYHGIIGALQYLNLTHSDFVCSINFVSHFMYVPTHSHLKIVRRILH